MASGCCESVYGVVYLVDDDVVDAVRLSAVPWVMARFDVIAAFFIVEL